MSNLVDKVKTYFIGTKDEIKEKVNGGLAFGFYTAEAICCMWFYSDAVNGKFNSLAAPFAIDGTVRVIRSYQDIVKHLKGDKWDTPPYKNPGIIGTAKEIKQKYLS